MFSARIKCVALHYLVCCEIVRPVDVNARAGEYRAECLLRGIDCSRFTVCSLLPPYDKTGSLHDLVGTCLS